MVQHIKVGKVVLEVQEGIAAPPRAQDSVPPLKAEKPETPEPLAEPQYIYRPNDPFQSAIDEARAIASISASHKPWVKKAWFVMFILGPLFYAELYALSLMFKNPAASPWPALLEANAVIVPVWLMYYCIWRRKVKK